MIYIFMRVGIAVTNLLFFGPVLCIRDVVVFLIDSISSLVLDLSALGVLALGTIDEIKLVEFVARAIAKVCEDLSCSISTKVDGSDYFGSHSPRFG